MNSIKFKIILAFRFLSLPNLILFLFLACIGRQYVWSLSGSWLRNFIAWFLSSAISATIVYLLADEQDPTAQEESRLDWVWLVVVVLPLLAFFFLRAPFPSLEFDNLNYHMVNTERALRGWPVREFDFFPGTLLPNPAPDMVFGVVKYLLGYRLGPLLNVGVLLWVASLINQLLKAFIPVKGLRYLCLLFVITTEPIIALVNFYMIDLLPLPLLLGALILIINLPESRNTSRSLIKISLFLGICVAFKLTSLFFVLPLSVFLLYQVYFIKKDKGILPSSSVLFLTAAAFLLPSAFFFVYMYHLTGNPLFPFYNNIFHSPLIEAITIRENAMGPRSTLEALFWPLSGLLLPDRLVSESWDTFYSGRLQLGVIFAFGVFFAKTTPRTIKQISIVMLCGTWLWAFSSGIIRYAIFSEILGGLFCIYILAYIYQEATKFHEQNFVKIKRKFAFISYMIFLFFQFLIIVWFGLTYFYCFCETHLCDRIMQPQAMNRFSRSTYSKIGLQIPFNLDVKKNTGYWREAGFLFRDRNSQEFFTVTDIEQFRDVEMWINVYDGTSAFMTIAAPDLPIVSVAKFLEMFDYMKSAESQRLVRELIQSQRSKKMYTLLQIDHYDAARRAIERIPIGLHFGPIQKVSLPLYSPYTRTNLLLVEIFIDDKIAHRIYG